MVEMLNAWFNTVKDLNIAHARYGCTFFSVFFFRISCVIFFFYVFEFFLNSNRLFFVLLYIINPEVDYLSPPNLVVRMRMSDDRSGQHG